MKKILFALMVVLGLTNSAYSQMAQAASPGAGVQSVISFATEKHDFGTIPQGIPVTHNFSFTNTGKEPLVIKSATGSCGCTVPEYTQEAIAPGGKGNVKVTYNAAALGVINRTVTVATNSATTPTIVLTIGGEVKAAATSTAPAAAPAPAKKAPASASPKKN